MNHMTPAGAVFVKKERLNPDSGVLGYWKEKIWRSSGRV
jgi:hypothetical protein